MGAEPPVESRGSTPGQGQSPPEAETFCIATYIKSTISVQNCTEYRIVAPLQMNDSFRQRKTKRHKLPKEKLSGYLARLLWPSCHLTKAMPATTEMTHLLHSNWLQEEGTSPITVQVPTNHNYY